MLTLAQAASRLGVSPSTLRTQIHAGRLRGRLVGKTWTVTEREVDRYAVDSRGRVGRPRTNWLNVACPCGKGMIPGQLYEAGQRTCGNE
jgi:excisionase family DNA binding protein